MTRAAFQQGLQAALGSDRPRRIGVAVSGGGDSLALLCLLAERAGAEIAAVTVDHGLRPEAAAEAAAVAALCGTLGVGHATLRWQGWDGAGNLQDQARRARLGLIADWARSEGIAHVALGHTADDVAETFLLRLARSAGLDGLSAMAPRRDHLGIAWLRPMLDMRRADLRAYLDACGIAWADDPTNEDETFDRVRARRALAELEPLGIGVAQITRSARLLDRSRAALAELTLAAARRCAATDLGDVVIDPDGLRAEPPEIARRLFGGALRWVGAADYPPRAGALGEFIDRVMAGEAAALHGCLGLPGQDGIRICREYAAVRGLRLPADGLWDGRWQFRGARPVSGHDMAALGEAGLAACPDWRATGRPRAALLASPALWLGGALVSAPQAGRPNGWRIVIAPNCPDFHAFLISR